MQSGDEMINMLPLADVKLPLRMALKLANGSLYGWSFENGIPRNHPAFAELPRNHPVFTHRNLDRRDIDISVNNFTIQTPPSSLQMVSPASDFQY